MNAVNKQDITMWVDTARIHYYTNDQEFKRFMHPFSILNHIENKNEFSRERKSLGLTTYPQHSRVSGNTHTLV